MRQHMVDVGGQVEPVMPDYADDAHDAVVVLRAQHTPIFPLAPSLPGHG